jgi:hypothetical protein
MIHHLQYLKTNAKGQLVDIDPTYFTVIGQYPPFRYFDIPNFTALAKKIYNYIRDNVDLSNISQIRGWNTLDTKDFFKNVPEFQESFKSITNSKPKGAAAIVRIPKSIDGVNWTPPHPHLDASVGLKVLLPIKNCEKSYTKFYDPTGGTVHQIIGNSPTNIGNSWWELTKDSPFPREQYSAELIRPIIFDPQRLHDGIPNQSIKDLRISLNVSFENLPRDLLYSILKYR